MARAKVGRKSPPNRTRISDPAKYEQRVEQVRLLMARNDWTPSRRNALAEEWGVQPTSLTHYTSEASRRNTIVSTQSDASREVEIRIVQQQTAAELDDVAANLRSIVATEMLSGSSRTAVEALRTVIASIDTKAKVLGIGAKSATVQIALVDSKGNASPEAIEFVGRVMACVGTACGCAEKVQRMLAETHPSKGTVVTVDGAEVT